MLLLGGSDEIGTGHSRLHAATGRQIAGGHSCEVVRGDLQQALLEALAFLEREAGEPVDRLAPALDVR